MNAEEVHVKILTHHERVCYGIEWVGKTFYLREEVDVLEIGDPLKVIQRFNEIFDMSLIETQERTVSAEWDEETLRKYLEKRKKYQFPYFKSLVEAGGWRLMDDVKKDLKKLGLGDVVSQDIAGARSGNRRAAKSWYGMETLDEKVRDDDTGQYKYRIKPKYLGLMKEVFPEIEKGREE